MMMPVIVIAGPTAVGKTDCAIWLAKHLKTEIISADSMQVYRYMDIGTAKPSADEQAQVHHHLIDLVTPEIDFSVADYQRLFEQTVIRFEGDRKIPLIVGGTGLYIRACLGGFALEQIAKSDPKLRDDLKNRAAHYGNDVLHAELLKVDPEAASRIHPNDTVRVIRALEVYYSTGSPLSQIQGKRPSRYRPIYLFFDREREELYSRIDERVDHMVGQGLITEVERLLEQGYGPDLKPMQSLGYKQICDHLFGKIALMEAITLIKQKTRNYAKRQLTWFKREPIDKVIRLSGDGTQFYDEILEYIEGRL